MSKNTITVKVSSEDYICVFIWAELFLGREAARYGRLCIENRYHGDLAPGPGRVGLELGCKGLVGIIFDSLALYCPDPEGKNCSASPEIGKCSHFWSVLRMPAL